MRRTHAMVMPRELAHGRVILSGFGHGTGGPRLWLDGLDSSPWSRSSFAVYGETFTLQAGSERHCTGRHDLMTGYSYPCPQQLLLEGTEFEQCAACAAATGFNPAFYNAPTISVSQQRRNLEPHVVYLASFGPGTHKVGMTHAPRRSARLLEQGARLGVIIAEHADAYAARELESYVARELGLPEAIRGARKRQLLTRPVSLELARAELSALIRLLAERRRDVDPRAELVTLDQHYGAPDLFGAQITDLSETKPAAISGRCLGLVGDTLITSEGHARYMLCLSDILGHRVELSAVQRPNRFVGQLALPF